MEFLKWLESIRNPFLDALMLRITDFGAETLFIVVALVIFWCFDKKRGYYLLLTGFSGVLCTQILKMCFRIPRPWVLDNSFSPVEEAVGGATGYSFPSGHTQTSVTLYGSLARTAHRRWLQIAFTVLWVLIAFSRMYLGVHTPADVLTSVAIGLCLVVLIYPLMQWAFQREWHMYIIISAVMLLSLANLLFVELYPFPADIDSIHLLDARQNAWKLTCIILAMYLIYPMDCHVTRFPTRAVWWAQIIKLVGGVALTLGVRILLKAPLNLLLGSSVGGGVRYFLMVVVAGVLWPMTFGFFSRLGKKEPNGMYS